MASSTIPAHCDSVTQFTWRLFPGRWWKWKSERVLSRNSACKLGLGGKCLSNIFVGIVQAGLTLYGHVCRILQCRQTKRLRHLYCRSNVSMFREFTTARCQWLLDRQRGWDPAGLWVLCFPVGKRNVLGLAWWWPHNRILPGSRKNKVSCHIFIEDSNPFEECCCIACMGVPLYPQAVIRQVGALTSVIHCCHALLLPSACLRMVLGISLHTHMFIHADIHTHWVECPGHGLFNTGQVTCFAVPQQTSWHD